MNFLNLLKAHGVRVLLAASVVAPVASRCTPVPCYGQSYEDTTNDDHGESSQEPAQRPLEADPIETTGQGSEALPDQSGAIYGHVRNRLGVYTPFRSGNPVTIHRTDGLPNDQPIRSYFVQPFRGRSGTVVCTEAVPGLSSCTGG